MQKRKAPKRPVSKAKPAKSRPKSPKKIVPASVCAIPHEKFPIPEVSLVTLGSSVIPPVQPPIVQEEPKPCQIVDRGLPLPESYGVDRVVALPRDPKWVFCYWELTGGVLHEVRSQRGSEFVDCCSWVLRVHRISEGIAVDLEVDPSIGGWYVNVGRPGQYQFEISLVSADGEFVSLAASRVIATPSDSMSGVVDEQWASGFGSEKLDSYLAQMLGLKDGKFWSNPSSGGLVKGPGPGLPHSAQFVGASWGGQLSGRPLLGSMEFLGGSFGFMGASGMPSSLPGSLQMQVRTPRDGVLDANPNAVLQGKDSPNMNFQPDLAGAAIGKGRKFPRTVRGVPLPKCTWPKVFRTVPSSPDRSCRPSKVAV